MVKAIFYSYNILRTNENNLHWVIIIIIIIITCKNKMCETDFWYLKYFNNSKVYNIIACKIFLGLSDKNELFIKSKDYLQTFMFFANFYNNLNFKWSLKEMSIFLSYSKNLYKT